MNRSAIVLVRLVPAIWLGALIGVSFLATPVKFQAPSLTLVTALEVGRATFHVFTRMEWVLAVALIASQFAFVRIGWRWVLVATVSALVAAQALWLLPVLDERVAALIDGQGLPPSIHHALYEGMEAAKALGLAVLAVHAASWRAPQ